MRLIEILPNGDLRLADKFFHDAIPPYAILSHTWGDPSQEVIFEDMVAGTGQSKAGYGKIRFCGEQASRDGYKYFWVDSCCIKRSSDSELSESINSMFRWYQRADKCYVYLSDVSTIKGKGGNEDGLDTWKDAFGLSRWFTRGWTLQELVAPPSVQFFSAEGKRLGDKNSLEDEIHKRTGIDVRALRGNSLLDFTVSERMSWAMNRQTTRHEDKAYSLLGIFGIHMPLIYGEGEDNSLRRLRETIRTANDDLPSNALPLDNVPRREVIHFVPRVEQQKVLQDWLRSRTPSRMIVLQGMGGSGKTQLALQCCQTAREFGFVATFWINASSPSTVLQSYRSICRIISPAVQISHDDSETVSLVQNQIAKWSGRWLLVFDNYNDPNAFKQRAIRDYIPGRGGHVIFTSRNRSLSRLGLCIDLSRMTEEEGIKLLSHLVSGSEKSEIGGVVAQLGHLALAIDQAGAYIQSRRLSLNQFISHFRSRKMKVLEEIPDEWEYHDVQDPDNMRRLSVFTTWDMSLELINGTNEEEKHQKVQFLTLASFMDPHRISEVYFRSYCAGNDITWMTFLRTGDQWDTDKLADVLVEFSRLSLIQSFDRHEIDSSFSIHPLVRDCMKFRKSTDARSTVIELSNMLATFLRTHDVDDLPLTLSQETTRHINAWSDANENIVRTSSDFTFSLDDEAVPLFAHVYRTQGLYDDAERLYKRALEGPEQKLGPVHPNMLETIHSLAIVYQSQGRYNEAERLYERALDGREEKLGPTHPDTLRTVHNLANVYQSQGQYSEAKRLFARALEGNEEKLGPTHPNTLAIISSLANVYQSQGQYDEAERLFGQALEGTEQKLGLTHPNTLRMVQNLANVYQSQGRYNEAERLYERALEGTEQKLGPVHPNTLETVHSLAIVYQSQGRYGEAERLFGRALEGNEQKLGPTHPDTLLTVHDLAIVRQRQGQYNEAGRLFRRALEGWEEKLGPTHPRTLRTIQNIVNAYQSQGRYDEAERLLVSRRLTSSYSRS